MMRFGHVSSLVVMAVCQFFDIRAKYGAYYVTQIIYVGIYMPILHINAASPAALSVTRILDK